MNDQSSGNTVSRKVNFASTRKLTSGFCLKALERQQVVRCGFLLVLVVGVLAAPCSGQNPSWSRGILELPITYDDCKSRARGALEAEGYAVQTQGGDLMGDYYVGGKKGDHSVAIACNSSPNGKTWANVFVASSNPDGNVPGAERVKLQRRLVNSASSGGCNTPTISGIYITSPAGVIVFDRQNGNYISGRYGNDENSLVNRLEGTFECNVLKGKFTNTVHNTSGRIEYTFEPNGSRFSGHWWNDGGGDGGTNGTKRMALYRN